MRITYTDIPSQQCASTARHARTSTADPTVASGRAVRGLTHAGLPSITDVQLGYWWRWEGPIEQPPCMMTITSRSLSSLLP